MLTTESIVSHGVAALIGIFIGAAGTYFADRFTDQRRSQEQRRNTKDKFRAVEKQLPKLILEMRTDLNAGPEERLCREFVILRSNGIIFNSRQPVFQYYENEHDNLHGQVAILENHGYIVDSAINDVPRYRMTEEFVALLIG